MLTASRLFLLCEGCGVCRQHLLSLPKNPQANALSAAKCITCGKTIWLRIRPLGKQSPGLPQEADARAPRPSPAPAIQPERSPHPRANALKAYARRSLQSRGRALATREKSAVPLNLKAMRALSDAKYELQIANKRLDEYAPVPGLEHCPRCFLFNGQTVMLAFSVLEGAAKVANTVTASCPACAFVGSLPAMSAAEGTGSNN